MQDNNSRLFKIVCYSVLQNLSQDVNYRIKCLMSLFFLTFFIVYGSVHVYTFFKARQAVGFGTVTAAILTFFFSVLALAPLLVRLAERDKYESLARFLAYTGYCWMGILFLFFSSALVLDFYNILLQVIGYILRKDFTYLASANKPAFFVPLGCGILFAFYGYFEARNIRTERVVISSPKIPKTIKKLTIVQISDVHLGLIVREERLIRILDTVRKAEPDILVSTGDLVDGQINELKGLAELFKGVTPRYGKFAVTGNHEFYAGLKQALEFTEQSGFKILRGEQATVAGLVNIAGIDDPAGGSRVDEKALQSSLSRDKFNVFLKHRPAVEHKNVGLFDLQLSGHVHKGQIFPFNLVTHLFYPVKSGYSILPQNSSLYVSRGTGTWGPPIRFLSPPEVTVIELIPS